jgi:hypothetical protein
MAIPIIAQAEYDEVVRVAHKKKSSYFLFLFFLPYYFLRAVIVHIQLLFSPYQGKLASARFLRHFFEKFFRMKGIIHYFSLISPPETLQKPIVIIGNRYHFWSSLFAFTLFKTPPLVPLPHGMHFFSLPFFKPIKIIGSFFKCISYYDAPLPQALPTISTLLKTGYPVYVHANHGVNDLRSDTTLYLHRSVMELLKLDIDVYLMHLNGFENYKFTSFRNPSLVGVNFSLAADVLAGISLDDELSCGRKLCDFFGMIDYQWV